MKIKDALITILLIIVATFMLGYGARYFALKQNQYFAPQERQLENNIFKESTQYNDSMVRDLENFYLDYSKGTPMQQEIIAATVKHRYAAYDTTKLSYELKMFIKQCKGN